MCLSLLWSPKLLFLDEVTAGLDPKMRAKIWEKIRQLNAGGMTIVLTTHYMEEAQALCNRICMLYNGAITAIGTASELIRKFGGGKTIVIVLDREISKEIVNKMPKVGGVKVVLAKANSLVVSAAGEDVLGASDKIIGFFRQKGFNTVKSNIKEPSLEQVFINLTGSELKE